LIVLDNCEHVLDAAADLVDAILAWTSTVTVIATSREGLRVGAEHLWPVPSLELSGGPGSQAVELFVERAVAVNPSFQLTDPGRADAVMEICRRVDGIALAIELAAARMVSMSPQDVRDRLGDRFRLLSGSRRGLERHQTLRHAVGWSYDLLDDAERALLQRCSVFVDGFDLAAAAHLNDDCDEYMVLDGLDSLVRKSLLTVDQTKDHARYGLLETIRQFAEQQLAATGSADQARDRHARYFAEQAIAYWDLCDGSQPRVALDWVDVEFANLRAGFRWAADRGDLVTAGAIAAHTTMLAHHLQRFEPAGWAEEILPAATRAELPHLARLYTAASLCSQTGRAEAAVGYAAAAVGLEADPRYDPFGNGWSRAWDAIAHARAGRAERGLEIWADMAAQSGPAQLHGRCGLVFHSALGGRSEAVRAIAEETLAAARARANPYLLAIALHGYGRAFADTDPVRSLDAFRQGLAHTREHGLAYMEALTAREAARIEASHGDPDEALTLFDQVIGSFHQSGNDLSLALALAYLAVFFDRVESPEIAAILGGAVSRISTNLLAIPSRVVSHLRYVLGDADFERCAATGAAMELTEAVRYARDQIRLARGEASGRERRL
jgi:predicted ATPase